MMMRMLYPSLLACAALAASRPLPAQGELPSTLSAAARDTLTRLIDSVRATGLPTDPLVARAAEGVLKRVAEERIIVAVRALARRQAEARSALPSQISNATFAAAVSALQAGVSVQSLRHLAQAGAGRDDADLAVALVALADLIANRVSAEAAGSAIEQLLARGASEQTMTMFRIGVTHDIRAGLAPEAALTSQTKAFAGQLDAKPAGEKIGPAPTRRPTP